MATPKAIQLIALRNLPRTTRQINPHNALRAVISQSTPRSSQQPHTTARHFTTTHPHPAPNDSSTIDFAFLPNPDVFPDPPETYRVPILHSNFPHPPTTTLTPSSSEDPPVMKPEISTMAGDAVYTPLADLSDGHAMNIDFHAMADRVAVNLRSMKVPEEEQASIIKQLWGDIVDDLFRKKNEGTGSKA